MNYLSRKGIAELITGPNGTVKLARKLRSEMSLPEGLLWRELRKRPGGFKFRRQHPAGAFVIDFYCAALKLAIEVDGAAHDAPETMQRDATKSHFLRSQGVATLRIPAKAVLEDIASVMARVAQVCVERAEKLAARRMVPLHHPADGAPPPSCGWSPSPAGGGTVRETAYAKINLALHVRRRRDDGYHELETLFAFVDAGDELTAQPSARDSLRVVGEFGRALDDPFGNIVAKALGALPHGAGWDVTLEKNLPVAAGLGGGSADAGAVFRMVKRAHGLPGDWHARAAKLGADVPACVESLACIGRGTGTELEPIANDLAGAPVLLVNPRIPLATGPVFTPWDGVDRGGLEGANLRAMALNGRNDLEAPALSLVPEIGDVLEALRQTGAWMTRMSGSGATCFALYDTAEARDEARAAMPDAWWTLAGALR